jgi:AbrB family looped-hinge helix DNA binding protein
MFVTVASRGRGTLPAQVRRQLRMRAGTKLDVIVTGDDRLEIVRPTGSLRDLEHLLPRPRRVLGLPEIDEAIRRWVQRELHPRRRADP